MFPIGGTHAQVRDRTRNTGIRKFIRCRSARNLSKVCECSQGNGSCHSVAAQLRHRRQALLCVPRSRRGGGQGTRTKRRLPCESHLRRPQTDRPDDCGVSGPTRQTPSGSWLVWAARGGNRASRRMWHQYLLNGFFDGHCPALKPYRGSCRVGQRLPCGLQTSFEFGLLRGCKCRANGLAERSRRASQPEGAGRLLLCGGGAGEAFQHTCNTPFVAKRLEHSHAFPVERLRDIVVLLVASQVSQVSE